MRAEDFMLNIKILQSIETDTTIHAVGDVICVDERTATEWLSLGFAERAETHPDQPESCVRGAACCKAVRRGAQR